MNRTRFIQGLNSNIELSDKERRRAIRNSINKRPWKLNCTIAMEEFAELTQQVSKQIRGYGDRIGLIEEMADAYICLKLLESIFNISPEDMQKAIDVKMDRERQKLMFLHMLHDQKWISTTSEILWNIREKDILSASPKKWLNFVEL